eukprot:TRINITY_DN6791_c0_g1_i1.p1 TRINITY_DN6791_c0_g1~~TRINITY_DN6791_c0_g1_i1.p1  ORF type:complete len:379 (+),score=166.93 TRINITY_DN6791_c0_g1_i1:72-1208(+)
MAPRVAGKRASSPADRSGKKARIAELDTKLEAIAAALQQTDLPPSSRSLLSSFVRDSLGVYKADRHAYQEEAISMSGEALSSLLEKLKATVEETWKGCENPFGVKADRAAALVAAEKRLSEAEGVPAEKQPAVTADAEDVKAARQLLRLTHCQQAAADADLDEASSKKKWLEDGLKVHLEALRAEGGGKAHVQHIRGLRKHGFSFDQTLMTSLSAWEAKKKLEERSDFDKLILQQLEAEMGKHMQAVDKLLAEGEPGKAERAKKVAEAEAIVGAAVAKAEASKKAFQEAKTEEKAARDEVAACQKAVKNFLKDLQVLCDAYDAAKEALKDFETGALAHFEELKELAPPPEVPEPEMETPAPAEEATGAATDAPAEAEG